MKNKMDPNQHSILCQRIVDLGRTNSPQHVPELIRFLSMPSAEIRRLAASALAKLADFGADASIVLPAVAHLALHDDHPQVQQYALKALKSYGAAAALYLHDLDDLSENLQVKEYVRRSAYSASTAIREAIRLAEVSSLHRCVRCSKLVTPDEHIRSQTAFQRTFCDPCFDEVYLKRRNFDTKVELNKTITARQGTLVQSDGERLLADWFTSHHIAYRYDERFRILNGYSIRPDFYLSDFDIYVEYWGMDTIDYKIGMLMKQQLYQQEGKRLISIYPANKSDIDKFLCTKLAFFGYNIAPGSGES